MKIAILGGGFTGIAAAYDLRKKEHEVTIFEKEPNLGGLASGFFGKESWEWPLDRAYHHIFATDSDIRDFIREVGFGEFDFKVPLTSSLYENPDKSLARYQLDSPISLLRFPLLSPISKIRAGATLAFLKLTPFLTLFEKLTAKEFLMKTMGGQGWSVLWQQLFQKKFGKYAEKVLTSFFWARVTKRTQSLGYPKGGFQGVVDYCEKKLLDLGVKIDKGVNIASITKKGEKYIVNGDEFDVVISTLPTNVLTKVGSEIFDSEYLGRFSKLSYLHAVNLIIASKEKLLKDEYWLNICVADMPAMVVVQHTNFVESSHYGGDELLYIAKYVDSDDPLVKGDEKYVFSELTKGLREINPDFDFKSGKYWVMKAGLAQPIFDTDFVANRPTFATPQKDFYVANLDMTYPYDRGTNYAVKLGREVAKIVDGR